MRRVTRYPKIRERLSPALAGRLVNELRGLAEIVPTLPPVTAAAGPEKIQHPGTFNANPVSAAAGAAALGVIAESDANARADAAAKRLRGALNEVFTETRTPWAAYGTSSDFHVFLNTAPPHFDPYAVPTADLKPPEKLAARLRLALLLHGVDVNGRISGFLSATHGDAEIAATADAFRSAIGMLRAEGELPAA